MHNLRSNQSEWNKAKSCMLQRSLMAGQIVHNQLIVLGVLTMLIVIMATGFTKLMFEHITV